MDLVHDLLDKQVLDKAQQSIGRIDGVTLVLRDDGPPRVGDALIGAHVLADRLHPRLARWTTRLRRWWRPEPPTPTRIAVKALQRHGPAWACDELDARDTPALAWELWLRTHVIARFPLRGR